MQILWNNLMRVAELHNMPWVIACDFNETLINEDKFGGRVVSVSRSLSFKECLDKCNMIDIGFGVPRFTWTNRREVQALIQERIDRYFVNPSWVLLYLEAKVTHLTRIVAQFCWKCSRDAILVGFGLLGFRLLGCLILPFLRLCTRRGKIIEILRLLFLVLLLKLGSGIKTTLVIFSLGKRIWCQGLTVFKGPLP